MSRPQAASSSGKKSLFASLTAVRRTCLAWIAVIASILLLPSLARAHDAFEITADGIFSERGLALKITMSASTAGALFTNPEPEEVRITPDTFTSYEARLLAEAGRIFEVRGGDTPLAMVESRVQLTPENDVEFDLLYQPPAHGPLTIRALHVERLGYGYGATVRLNAPDGRFLGAKLLMGDDTRIILPIASASRSDPQPVAPPAPSFKAFFHLGVEHIVTGYDHLLFLAALLVACRGFRAVLIVISCFTLAHSLTLGLAALERVSLPASVVEPLIAASILYVGVENLLRLRSGTEAKGRGWLTFAFGLVHGFGFASILRETGLGQGGSDVVIPLFAFNLGVEGGQIAIAALALPLWQLLKRWGTAERYGAAIVSSLVALAGAFWLWERTLG